MELTAEERRAVEAGEPLRCVITGTDLKCVILRGDLFDKLQRPFEIIDRDILDEIYSDVCADSPDDWKTPGEWFGEKQRP